MCPISYILKGVVPVEGQESIDLGVIIEIIKKNRRNLMKIIVGSTLLAMAVAFILPKQYESTTLVRAKSSQQGSGISLQAASALAMLSGGSMSTPTQAYIEMMKSRSVLDPIIAQLDLPDEEKKNWMLKVLRKVILKYKLRKVPI
jgi:succinoglycan biosynthesis transport protein ExoP